MDKLNKTYLTELNTGIVILDSSLRVLEINPSAMSFLDVSELASLGNDIDQIFYEEPDNKKALMNSMREHRGFTKTDALLHLKKGGEVLCDYSVHPITQGSDSLLLIELINKESSSELKERYRQHMWLLNRQLHSLVNPQKVS